MTHRESAQTGKTENTLSYRNGGENKPPVELRDPNGVYVILA